MLPDQSLSKPEVFLLSTQLEEGRPLFSADAGFVALLREVSAVPVKQFRVRLASVDGNNLG